MYMYIWLCNVPLRIYSKIKCCILCHIRVAVLLVERKLPLMCNTHEHVREVCMKPQPGRIVLAALNGATVTKQSLLTVAPRCNVSLLSVALKMEENVAPFSGSCPQSCGNHPTHQLVVTVTRNHSFL